MSFTVTVLGCSGMYATQERAASGYLVEYGDIKVWLDAGSGTWRNLLGHIDYERLDGIVLTHRHPDHTTDIFQAYHARMYGQAEAMPPIPLWAPQETVDRLLGFAAVDESFDMRPIAAGDQFDFEGATFSFHRMAHPAVTVGVRISYGGGVFAYSADTGPDGELGSLARDADLFICEATFQDGDGPWEGHMHASEAAATAKRSNVAHLVLSHLPPRRDLGLSLAEAHHEAEGIKIELAHDGHRYEVIG
jgi:ribonuclease BN (tRNA processing enzyme)